jgi:hypothetical protein
MADHFADQYWSTKFWTVNYFQGGEVDPNAMRASLSGAGAISATLEGLAEGEIAASLVGSGQVTAELTFTGQAVEAEVRAGGGRGRRSWADFYASQPKKKRKDEEEEKPVPLEVVKIKKGKTEIITGIVQPVSTPKPLPAWPKDNISARIAKQENETRIEYRKRLRRIAEADDEWLMMQ